MAYPGERKNVNRVNQRLDEATGSDTSVPEPTELKHEESGAYDGVRTLDAPSKPTGPYVDTLEGKYGDEREVRKNKKRSPY